MLYNKLLNSLLLLFLCISFLTCAWNQEEIGYVSREDQDLVDAFQLSSADMEKFKSQEIVNDQSPQEKEKIVDPKNVSKVSKKKSKKESPMKIPETENKDFSEEFISYDKKSQQVWNLFKPRLFINEKMEIDVQYFGVTAGKVILQTLPPKMVAGKSNFHFYAKMVSAPFYKYIYSINDYLEVFVDQEAFLPTKYVLVQRESKQDVDDLQLFDHNKNETMFWYQRIKNGETKKENKTEKVPQFFLDSFSPLYFIRGLPLEVGDKYEFPIITRAKLWIIKCEILERTSILVKGKEVPAIKVKAETHFPGVLSKKGDISFYYSDDNERRILKFEAKVKIGTILGELTKYESGVPL
jgi:hypothetical protein